MKGDLGVKEHFGVKGYLGVKVYLRVKVYLGEKGDLGVLVVMLGVRKPFADLKVDVGPHLASCHR